MIYKCNTILEYRTVLKKSFLIEHLYMLEKNRGDLATGSFYKLSRSGNLSLISLEIVPTLFFVYISVT